MRPFAWCLLATLALAAPRVTAAQGLIVAAASDLQVVLPAIAERFERETGQPVRLTFGSSGHFFSQIQNGAPFDVFLSADVDYPRRLVDAGLAVRETLREYATGRLVVWTRRDRGLSLDGGLRALDDPGVRRIAIANPAHAPYGRAAVDAIRSAGLYDALGPKLVLGENISQAAQFAQSGNADAGIIALSIALTRTMEASGIRIAVPDTLHPAIRQGAVVVAASTQRALASRFVAQLSGPEVMRLLERFGFGLPARTAALP